MGAAASAGGGGRHDFSLDEAEFAEVEKRCRSGYFKSKIEQYRSALTSAIRNNRVDLLELLIPAGNCKALMPLHIAASFASLESLEILLSAGFPVGARNESEDGETALHRCCAVNNTTSALCATALILSHRKVLRSKNFDGDNALISAVRQRNAYVVEAICSNLGEELNGAVVLSSKNGKRSGNSMSNALAVSNAKDLLNMKDSRGNTAIDVAKQLRLDKIERILSDTLNPPPPPMAYSSGSGNYIANPGAPKPPVSHERMMAVWEKFFENAFKAMGEDLDEEDDYYGVDDNPYGYGTGSRKAKDGIHGSRGSRRVISEYDQAVEDLVRMNNKQKRNKSKAKGKGGRSDDDHDWSTQSAAPSHSSSQKSKSRAKYIDPFSGSDDIADPAVYASLTKAVDDYVYLYPKPTSGEGDGGSSRGQGSSSSSSSVCSGKQVREERHWREYHDALDDTPYFYNLETGESVWERPKPTEIIVTSGGTASNHSGKYDVTVTTLVTNFITQASAEEERLNSSWECYMDEESGYPYYYNNVTGESTWGFDDSQQQYEGAALDEQYVAEPEPVYVPEDETRAELEAWVYYVDEESNYPYYYNTVTGETKWENPWEENADGTAQGTVLKGVLKDPSVPSKSSCVLNVRWSPDMTTFYDAPFYDGLEEEDEDYDPAANAGGVGAGDDSDDDECTGPGGKAILSHAEQQQALLDEWMSIGSSSSSNKRGGNATKEYKSHRRSGDIEHPNRSAKKNNSDLSVAEPSHSEASRAAPMPSPMRSSSLPAINNTKSAVRSDDLSRSVKDSKAASLANAPSITKKVTKKEKKKVDAVATLSSAIDKWL